MTPSYSILKGISQVSIAAATTETHTGIEGIVENVQTSLFNLISIQFYLYRAFYNVALFQISFTDF